MIKPDAVEKNYIGAILNKISEAGFRITALRMTRLSTETAGEFYEIHKERPFYGELVAYMSSGPIVAAILEKENAVEDFRKLIGATDPKNHTPPAPAASVRQTHPLSRRCPACHPKDDTKSSWL